MLDTFANFNSKNNRFIEVSNLLAEHRHPTQIRSNVGFWGEGKTGVPEKTSRSKVENQQNSTQL